MKIRNSTFNLPNFSEAHYQISGIGVKSQFVFPDSEITITAQQAVDIYTTPSDGILLLNITGAYAENYTITIYNPDGSIYLGGQRVDDTNVNTELTCFMIHLVKGARVTIRNNQYNSNQIVTLGTSDCRFFPDAVYPIIQHIIKYNI